MIKKYQFRQFCKPSGFIGRITGWTMALKNQKRNDWLTDLIHPKPGNRLLEIGFGPGTVIKALLNKESDITIWGIDHSEIMLRQATKINKEAVNDDKFFCVSLLLKTWSSPILPLILCMAETSTCSGRILYLSIKPFIQFSNRMGSLYFNTNPGQFPLINPFKLLPIIFNLTWNWHVSNNLNFILTRKYPSPASAY